MSEREKILEKIRQEAQRLSSAREHAESGVSVVILSGTNRISKSALMDRDVVVRFFPFHIGRLSRKSGDVFREVDLMLPDTPPYRISQHHLTLERRNDTIVVIDQQSRSGTWVNGIPVGKQPGGIPSIPLNEGDNEVLIGGRDSPFMFCFTVTKAEDPNLTFTQVRLGERFVPVESLYSRLCNQAQYILTALHLTIQNRLRLAQNLIMTFASEAETTDSLYSFSTSPETFPDILVAHSVNVAILTVKLARGLSLPPEQTVILGMAALLHDIGFYDIPPDIIYKKEILADHEFEIMKRHAMVGYQVLAEASTPFEAIPAVALEHHERIDGSGYPQGISSPSDNAELIGMVDFFEAVTHSRPQRGPYTPHEGMRMLLQLKDGLFRARLIKAFVREFSLYPTFSVVRLNTGEIGQVIRTNPHWPLRPTVHIVFDRMGNPVVHEERELDLSEHNNIYIIKDISDRVFINHYFALHTTT